MKVLTVAYGVVCYLIFLIAFLYAIGFVGDLVVPKSIDTGQPGLALQSILIDAVLLGIFAIQHSVMARPAFKRATATLIPRPVERSTYVLLASLALLLLFWQWKPLPNVVWSVGPPIVRAIVWGLFGLGWALVLSSTFLINHFDLFGLRQVWTYRRTGETPPAEFVTPMFYKVVRHPIYLGFLMAFWSAPTMTVGRLFFATATTIYVLIAIQLEERDLVGVFGDRYVDYRRRVSMLLPMKW